MTQMNVPSYIQKEITIMSKLKKIKTNKTNMVCFPKATSKHKVFVRLAKFY